MGLDAQMGIRAPSAALRNFEVSGRANRASESVPLLKESSGTREAITQREGYNRETLGNSRGTLTLILRAKRLKH